MKSRNALIIRAPGKGLPNDVVAMMLAEYKTCWGFAAANPGKNTVGIRKNIGPFSVDDINAVINHESLKNKQLYIHFGDDPNVLTGDDVQPYTLIANEDGKPLLVAFLDGDFSQFKKEGELASAEMNCVKSAIIPRILKAYKYAGNDLAKLMTELKDDLTAEDFANMMLGDNGSITLLAANGDTHTFLVEGETISGSFPEYWTSNTFNPTAAVAAGPVDDLADEFGDEAPAPKPTVAPATPAPKPVAQPQTAKAAVPGIPGAPSGAPVHTDQPDVRTAPNAAPEQDPVKELEHGNPDAILTINIPQNMRTDKAGKWITARMPENFKLKVITGLKTLSCKRSEANGKFLQTYVEQNKLSGLDALAPQPVSKSALKSAASVLKLPGAPKPKVEQGYPERVEDHRQPVEEPTKKDTAPHHTPGSPDVVTEPLPVLSPTQKEELLTFIASPDIAAAYDRHGKVIAHPAGLEQLMKQVDSFSKQFGDKITLMNIAKQPLENLIKYVAHDPGAAARIMYMLGVELLQTNSLLDAVTEPHTTKNKTEEAARVLRPAAASGEKPLVPGMPARKTA